MTEKEEKNLVFKEDTLRNGDWVYTPEILGMEGKNHIFQFDRKKHGGLGAKFFWLFTQKDWKKATREYKKGMGGYIGNGFDSKNTALTVINIPVDPSTPMEIMQTICDKYDCLCRLQKGFLEVVTLNPIDLFWIGCNFNGLADESRRIKMPAITIKG